MEKVPRISVVTPSYNQGTFLEKTLCSVLDQGYPQLEYIVIDGGSSDDSVSIIKKYEKHLAYWVSEKDRGQSHAINKGFQHATGDIFAWLNSDDYYEPGALQTVADYASRFPDTGVFVGHGRKVNVSGEQVYYKEPGQLTFEEMCQWLSGGNFMQPSCFFRREVWEQAGPLDESVHIALDVDLWLKMVKKAPFMKIDKLLSTATMHPDAKTAAFRNRMVVDCALVVIRAGGEQYVRPELDALADKLSHLQKQVRRITDNPIYKLLKPIINRQDKA
jgi:glycosyltransferase involved in cell wall biosynthesis